MPDFLMPRFLYHGTAESAAEAILTNGIVPRYGDRPSTWGKIPSAVDRVYLAEGYAPYYAFAAARDGERHALVEVCTAMLDERLLRPDEDFIAQALKQQNPNCRNLSWAELNHLVLTMGNWDDCWRESLQALGTCAYTGAIPAEAINRVSLYTPANNPEMAMAALDPSISVINWRLCAAKYRLLTRWYMGDDVTLNDWLGVDVALRSLMSEEHVSQIAVALKRQRVEVRKPMLEVGARDAKTCPPRSRYDCIREQEAATQAMANEGRWK